MSDDVSNECASPKPEHDQQNPAAVSPARERRGVAVYDANPFMGKTFVGKTKRVLNGKGDMMLVKPESGEVVAPVAGFWHAEEVDATQFVKLYINGVKAFKELTNAGARVFELLYVQMQANIGKDTVMLAYPLIDQRQSPISRSTFQRGLQELVTKGFIAATPAQSLYWINPDYVWNGDRLAFVREYRRRKDGDPPGQQRIAFGFQ